MKNQLGNLLILPLELMRVTLSFFVHCRIEDDDKIESMVSQAELSRSTVNAGNEKCSIQ